MATYEHVFLARQDVSAQQVDDLVKQYTTVIETNGGKVGRVENWGLKSLTYRIKKNRKAHYVLMDIDAPAPAVHEMERQMRIVVTVLTVAHVKIVVLAKIVHVVHVKTGYKERFPWLIHHHPLAHAARSIAVARLAHSLAPTLQRLITRTCVCCSVTFLNAARLFLHASQLFARRSSANWPRPSSAPVSSACCHTFCPNL